MSPIGFTTNLGRQHEVKRENNILSYDLPQFQAKNVRYKTRTGKICPIAWD